MPGKLCAKEAAMITFRCSLVISIAALCGCNVHHCELFMDGRTQLLREPYPMGYPTSKPAQNEVLAELIAQKAVVLDDRYEKDFHLYKVKTADGRAGYVIGGPGIREVGCK